MPTSVDAGPYEPDKEGEETTHGAPAGGPPVVAFEGVAKRFHNIYALRNVSVTVSPGEIYGILGPTGSGKSTMLRLLLGFTSPDEGMVSLFGRMGDLTHPRSRVGYLPERPQYPPNFTGYEYVHFHARLSGLDLRSARTAAGRAIEVAGLGPIAGKRIRSYMPETMQRLGIAVALASGEAGPPDLLVLDEPSANLSRATQLHVRDIVLEHRRRGGTVVIASHRITEIERACTSVAILRGGRLIAETVVENSPRIIIVAVPRESAPDTFTRLMMHLRNLHPFVTVSGGQGGAGPLVVSLPSGPHIMNAAGIKASALRALVDASWDVISVYVERKDLESIYLQSQPPAPVDGSASGSSGAGPRMTAPLGPRGGLATGPLGPLNTGPLPSITSLPVAMPLQGQGIRARSTRPLLASEVSSLPAYDRDGETAPSRRQQDGR